MEEWRLESQPIVTYLPGSATETFSQFTSQYYPAAFTFSQFDVLEFSQLSSISTRLSLLELIAGS